MRAVSDPSDLSARDVLARYPTLRDDHLRYLEKWGLVRSGATRTYGFADLAVIRQTAAALAEGRPFRAVVRQLEAERSGQLTLDFRLEARPARILALTPRAAVPDEPGGEPTPLDVSKAEGLFNEASSLDTGDEAARIRAADLYRQ